jgi:hypothetical protein
MTALMPAIIIIVIIFAVSAPFYMKQKQRANAVKAELQESKEQQNVYQREYLAGQQAYLAEMQSLVSLTERQAIATERIAAALEARANIER